MTANELAMAHSKQSDGKGQKKNRTSDSHQADRLIRFRVAERLRLERDAGLLDCWTAYYSPVSIAILFKSILRAPRALSKDGIDSLRFGTTGV